MQIIVTWARTNSTKFEEAAMEQVSALLSMFSELLRSQTLINLLSGAQDFDGRLKGICTLACEMQQTV